LGIVGSGVGVGGPWATAATANRLRNSNLWLSITPSRA
jgi:hypothetical protein